MSLVGEVRAIELRAISNLILKTAINQSSNASRAVYNRGAKKFYG